MRMLLRLTLMLHCYCHHKSPPSGLETYFVKVHVCQLYCIGVVIDWNNPTKVFHGRVTLWSHNSIGGSIVRRFKGHIQLNSWMQQSFDLLCQETPLLCAIISLALKITKAFKSFFFLSDKEQDRLLLLNNKKKHGNSTCNTLSIKSRAHLLQTFDSNNFENVVIIIHLLLVHYEHRAFSSII